MRFNKNMTGLEAFCDDDARNFFSQVYCIKDERNKRRTGMGAWYETRQRVKTLILICGFRQWFLQKFQR